MVSKNTTRPFKISDPETGQEITIDDYTIQEIYEIILKRELIKSIRRLRNG